MNGQRPTAVTVFGVMNMVYGGLILMKSAFGLLGLACMSRMGGPGMGGAAALPKGMMTWSTLVNGAAIPVAIVLIVAGFGLFQMKPWGRTLSLGFAAYAILISIVDVALTAVYVMPQMMDRAAPPGAPKEWMVVGAVFGVGIGLLFRLIYPGCILGFMTRPKFKAAFLPPEQPGQQEEDAEVWRLR